MSLRGCSDAFLQHLYVVFEKALYAIFGHEGSDQHSCVFMEKQETFLLSNKVSNGGL